MSVFYNQASIAFLFPMKNKSTHISADILQLNLQSVGAFLRSTGGEHHQ